ncbi:MAG: DUF4234 domain-containing protein [Ruminiclostridium sp.]|nr:DUF4234 domain-containing protein [Ruminiclostridium sp.]
MNDDAVICSGCGTAAGNQTVQQNIYVQQPAAPAVRLATNRGLLKYILLSAITFGIYGLWLLSTVSSDINIIASRYDGRKTMHYCLLVFVVGPLTLGIAVIVWFHRISGRIGDELRRRGIAYSFGASDFWLWDIVGTFILIGPFVYMHKLFKAMNLLSENYNIYG